MSSTPDHARADADADDSVDLSRLQAELDGNDRSGGRTISDIAATADRSLFDAGFTFKDERVKGALDDLLVMLAGVRDSETHGKQLIEDLDEQFDTTLSPGTVYPRLHDLCDEGVLEQRELVRTKEYTISDPESARDTIAESARQHLALGLAFKAALEEGDFE